MSSIREIERGTIVDDIHSQLNATRVAEIVKPETVEALRAAVDPAEHLV